MQKLMDCVEAVQLCIHLLVKEILNTDRSRLCVTGQAL